jgi:phosphoglycerate-specific signal transduction histidine kinase
MKEVITRVLSVVVYFALISGTTFITSWILDVNFKDAFIPVALGVIVTDIVSFQYRISKLESNSNEIVKQVEKRLQDKLKFETNSRVIGDNLNTIIASINKMETIERDYEIKRLERELEKIKKEHGSLI